MAVLDPAERAVAAVVHPHLTAVQPRGVRAREPAGDRLSRLSGEDHAAAVPGKIANPGATRRDAIRGGLELAPDRRSDSDSAWRPRARDFAFDRPRARTDAGGAGSLPVDLRPVRSWP